MIGFVFANEKEAKGFLKKVQTKKVKCPRTFIFTVASILTHNFTAKILASDKKKKAAKGGKIDKSLISGPTAGSFVHVAHMGYDAENGFVSKNVDPSWNAFLGALEDHGVDRNFIVKEMDFIENFMKKAQSEMAQGMKKKPPPPPAPRRLHGQQDSTSAALPSLPSITPPPPSRSPPPPIFARMHQVPQPPSRTPQAPFRTPQSQAPPAPSRPPPPSRTPQPPPPPPPIHSTTISAPVPPPPPPPPTRSIVPPPPPPPPMRPSTVLP